MRKLSVLFILFLFLPSNTLAAVPESTVGRILLDVERNGEAWYVDPVESDRFYLKNGKVAYQALRNFGLGITNSDLADIPVGVENRFNETDTDQDGLGDKLEEALGTDLYMLDTDGDGFDDRTEVQFGYNPNGTGMMLTDQALSDRLRGRILLQIEDRGQAWYVHPVDGKRYYMSDGAAAYQIMRYLSLGINTQDLNMIPVRTKTIHCDDSIDCFIGMMEIGTRVVLNADVSYVLDGFSTQEVSRVEYIPNADGSFTHRTRTTERESNYTEDRWQELLADGLTEDELRVREQKLSLDSNKIELTTCTYQAEELTEIIYNWKFLLGDRSVPSIYIGVLGECSIDMLNISV